MNVLLRQMLSHADPSKVAGLARFFKTGPGQYGEGDRFLGIKVPVTRAVVKNCWRQISFPELEECIESEYHEVRLAALLALVEIFKHSAKRTANPGVAPTAGRAIATPTAPLSPAACVDFYLSHTDRINNWDLVDLSCYPLLGEWLLKADENASVGTARNRTPGGIERSRTLLYDLARNGKTIWEQRIGIVSTMTFIRHGQLSDTFAIADILLQHPHDLIQKAVGWLLREAGKRDKAALEAYLNGTPSASKRPGPLGSKILDSVENASTANASTAGLASATAARYLAMPRTMLRYAIEKFPEKERHQYLSGTVTPAT